MLKHSATHYFACSKAAGKWMFGDNTDFAVIHNAIEPDQFTFNEAKRKKIRQQLALEDSFVIGHVGRFSYQKNHEFLIMVFAEMVKQKPNSRLLLIGDYVGVDTAFYNYARFYAKSYWIIIFYSAMVTPLVLSMYDDRFLAVVLSTTTIYKMVAIYLVCRFCITKSETI